MSAPPTAAHRFGAWTISAFSSLEVWGVTHADLRSNARVEAVLDWLARTVAGLER